MNAKLRIWNMILLTLALLGMLAGWMLGRDPSQLTNLVATLGLSQGALEAGMAAKRATYKVEVAKHEQGQETGEKT